MPSRKVIRLKRAAACFSLPFFTSLRTGLLILSFAWELVLQIGSCCALYSARLISAAEAREATGKRWMFTCT
jgi:hypothetical protein